MREFNKTGQDPREGEDLNKCFFSCVMTEKRAKIAVHQEDDHSF